tara:strand:+ start:6534 stop:8369 length:1836 start_codon:yes stop_codon:yes gene_type:complete
VARTPRISDDPAALADAIIAQVGKTIVLALPLGLGKPNHFANALVARAMEDPTISLRIFTALTLEVPRTSNELERRFLDPVLKRIFDGYPALTYADALHAGTLPPNIEVNEFFMLAGRWLNSPRQQQNYISANYTHVLRYIVQTGVNVIGQLVAPDAGRTRFSLSSNPDITLDLLEARRSGKADFVVVGETSEALPYMGGAAEIDAEQFDFILDSAALQFPLFAPPREPVTPTEYAIGIHAAGLVRDGGTLQIGIGSIGDALGQALVLRHKENAAFLDLADRLDADAAECGSFEVGLHGTSEMLVECFIDLMEAGVLKREVDGALVHAGFFLGSGNFYHKLREMAPETRAKIAMVPISYVNDLYGDEEKKRRARRDARFVNTAMMATLMGGVVSDGLEDGRVVSGVGGQYNFVDQAFALEDARSIIALRATRTRKGQTLSNIVWSYGHQTIPRHLRDIVVTEYGVADLRGKTDSEVIAALLSVADSRFQPDLLARARTSGKIPASYEIPVRHRNNTPERIRAAFTGARERGVVPLFPFDSDFTEIEQKLLPALERLRNASRGELLRLMLRGGPGSGDAMPCLERMGLAKPSSLKERSYRRLLLAALTAEPV